MEAEITIKCNIITDYDEAKRKEKAEKKVWSIYVEKNKTYFSDKVLRKDGIEYSYVVMNKTNTEIILSRREIWTKK